VREIQIPWWQTSFDNGEDVAVSDSIKSRHISQGPITKKFENKLAEYLGVPEVIATSSGTSALTLALMGSNIKPGDEVLVPNRTWIATAHAVQILGAVPVFVDTEVSLPIMQLSELDKFITPLTKAIIPVHMNGRGVDMETLNDFASERGLIVIEDAAQAFGSKDLKGNFLGTLSSAGCFSLSVAKIISTGQGGFIATKDLELASRLRNLRTHGVENTIEPEKWIAPGFNFRFTDVLASIGIVQLGLMEKRKAYAREIYVQYLSALSASSNCRIIPLQDYELGPYIEVIVDNRSAFREHLLLNGIETRPFYPDLSSAPYWKNRNYIELVNSKIFANHGLYLPAGPSITENQIDKVVDIILKFDS
jgi:perosamine synthetase